MKKAFKSLVIFAFCLAIILSTVSISFAAPGEFTLKASVTPTSITLKWTESSGADKYAVYRKQGTKWTSIKELSADTKSYTIKKLKTGEKYTYRVKAIDTGLLGSSSTYSNELTVSPSVSKVTSLKAAQYNYNTIKLTWKKLSGVTGYQIYYSTDGKTYKKLTALKSEKYTKTLKSGQKYYFKVRGYVKVADGDVIYGAFSSVKSIKIK